MLSPTISQVIPVTATGVGVGYDQFAASLGADAYRVDRLFLQATSLAQLRQVFTYFAKDANGEKTQRAIVPLASTSRDIPAMDIDLAKAPLVLDGRSGLHFELAPNERLMLLLTADAVKRAAALPGAGLFAIVARSLPAFSDYTDSL